MRPKRPARSTVNRYPGKEQREEGGGGLWRMEKGGPFIDVVCRTRYIGRDCRSIEPWRRCFRGTDFVLARFEDPSSPWVRNILSSFEEENVSSKDYALTRRLLDLWIWFLFYIYIIRIHLHEHVFIDRKFVEVFWNRRDVGNYNFDEIIKLHGISRNFYFFQEFRNMFVRYIRRNAASLRVFFYLPPMKFLWLIE